MLQIVLQKKPFPDACLYIYLVENFLLWCSGDKLKCFTETCIGSIDNFISDLLYSIHLCKSQKVNDFIQTVLLGFPKSIQMKYL